jgi:hypothetical protein
MMKAVSAEVPGGLKQLLRLFNFGGALLLSLSI